MIECKYHGSQQAQLYTRRGRVESKCLECNRAKAKAWYARNRFTANEASKARRKKLRQEVLVAYGGKCACCGEDQMEFLSIDHVNGGGNAHRRNFSGTTDTGAVLRWLKQQGFPKDGFQLLCHNCNGAKGYYGYCPHQRMAREAI